VCCLSSKWFLATGAALRRRRNEFIEYCCDCYIRRHWVLSRFFCNWPIDAKEEKEMKGKAEKIKLQVNWERLIPGAVEPEECTFIFKAIRNEAFDAAIEAIKKMQRPIYTEGYNATLSQAIWAIEELKAKE
jgi:hypothetical protein